MTLYATQDQERIHTANMRAAGIEPDVTDRVPGYPEEIYLSDKDLKGRIAFLSENGAYADQVKRAKAELDVRGVDWSDCVV